MNELPLKMEGVSFHYKAGEAGIDQVGLECSTGSWTAVMGPSGAGKTTLLYCASGLLPVQQGSVEIAGQNIARMKEFALTRMRRDHIGFVFQDYNLVEAFTCLQNVMLPQLFGGPKVGVAQSLQALKILGLDGYAQQYPSDISGGQRQRVAIARALVAQPDMIFADEPTGALDTRSSEMVLDALSTLVESGRTVLMVTHDPNVAAWAQRTVFLVDGTVHSICQGYTAEQLSTHLTSMTQVGQGVGR